jgi:hypothetical protein
MAEPTRLTAYQAKFPLDFHDGGIERTLRQFIYDVNISSVNISSFEFTVFGMR